MHNSIIPNEGTWVGRVWRTMSASKHPIAGPSVVSVVDGDIFDISQECPTVAELLARDDRVAVACSPRRSMRVASLDDLANCPSDMSDGSRDRLLSPVDLQCLKAAGVTFASSLIERMIEEQSGGDSSKAASLRHELRDVMGGSLDKITPGSTEAAALADRLRAKGMWSQYLEVGIGPYAEIFTKAPVLSSVGYGHAIGIHPESVWNNPEPELVLVVNAKAEIVGATLGNDVNLRDFEGRSALLLGRAKDNNASCAIGPFIRLFDDTFSYEDLGDIVVVLEIAGQDGFILQARSELSRISRQFNDLVVQASGINHQYPDGFVLMTGTVFVPTQDRDGAGRGFTHKIGDRVTISAPELGRLVNTVQYSNIAPPWTFGIGDLMHNLAQRKLLREEV